MKTVYSQASEYPACCGAWILYNFMRDRTEENWGNETRTINYWVRDRGYVTLYAITNNQQEWVEPQLQKYGFKLILEAGNANTNNTTILKHWVRIAPKSDVKRVLIKEEEAVA